MDKGEKDALDRVRKALRELESRLEKEALVLLPEEGDAWIGQRAREALSRRGIREEDFLGWLRLGVKHLSGACYLDLTVSMMRLPGKAGDIICIIGEMEPGHETFHLTQKEKEILGHSINGLTNKEIASRLNISPGTVNTHLDSIYRKLGVSNRIEASFVALRNGLIVPYNH